MSSHTEKSEGVVCSTKLPQANSVGVGVGNTFARELDEAVRRLREATENAPAANKQAIRHALLW